MKVIGIVVTTLVLVGVAAFLLFTQGNTSIEDKLKNQPGDFSRVPTDNELRGGMNNAGLTPLSAEGQVLHIHQHLDITINGQKIIIPANLGIGSTFISAVHTHDTTGIVHVESPDVRDFTLGQFFTQWGIKFDQSCVSTFCADEDSKLVVAVNGQPVANGPNHVLQSHDQIEIWYGPTTENPTFVPSYSFPAGL